MTLDFENYDVEADARRVRFSVTLPSPKCAFP